MEKTYRMLKLVLLALCFVALLLGAYYLYGKLGSQISLDALATQAPAQTETQTADGSETMPAGEEAASAAPDFTAYDAQGNGHKLSDFRGKPVILNFWASWCGPCKSEMPDFEEKYLLYGEDIHFVMVNLTDGSRETVDSASAFLTREGYRFPVYFDTAMEGAMAYSVSGVPVTYFIDAQGNLVAWGQGALSEDTLQKGIDMLLEP